MSRLVTLVNGVVSSNFRRLRSPYKASFAATYRCNLRCRICRIWELPQEQELSAAEIARVFGTMERLSWLDLTGGEITLREDIIEIIRVIARSAQSNLIFHISTNGQLPDKAAAVAQEVLKHGLVPVMNVSVDGPEEVNDRLRGARGGYARSLETFRRIKALRKGLCYLSCTLSRYNLGHVDELLKSLEKDIPGFVPSDIHFNISHTSSHYYHNQGIGLPEIRFDEVKRYFLLSARGNPLKVFLEKEYIRGLGKYCAGNKFPVGCQALNSTCFIDPGGTVYPCVYYNKPVGKLREHGFDLESLWESREAREIREGIRNKACPGCWSPCEAYPAILGRTVRNLVPFGSYLW
jgi:Fe-coproporphyrin III synthase